MARPETRRRIPGLHFVDRDLASIRAGVHDALDQGECSAERDPFFNPTPGEWITSVYSQLGLN